MSTQDAGFAAVSMQQTRDNLATTPAQRWAWLMEAMENTWALAQMRAKRGEVTLGPHGELLWSPQFQLEWEQRRAAP